MDTDKLLEMTAFMEDLGHTVALGVDDDNTTKSLVVYKIFEVVRLLGELGDDLTLIPNVNRQVEEESKC